MKFEELLALGVDEDAAKNIAAQHAAALKAKDDAHTEETKGLVSKKDELLAKLAGGKGESKEIEEFKAEFAPLIEQFKKMQQSDQEAAHADMLKNGKIEEWYAEKSKPLLHEKSELEKQLEEANKEKSRIQNEFNRTIIESALKTEISKTGIFKPETLNYISHHTAGLQLNDGAVFTKDGKPLADWVASEFKDNNPLYIAQGQGSGANGSQGGHNKPKVNKAAEEAKAKGDLSGFIKASISKED